MIVNIGCDWHLKGERLRALLPLKHAKPALRGVLGRCRVKGHAVRLRENGGRERRGREGKAEEGERRREREGAPRVCVGCE